MTSSPLLGGERREIGFGASLPAQQWFALAAVATLPFTYALTVDLRFPFKLYELALLLGALSVAASGRLRAARGSWRVLRPVWLFAAWAAAVVVLRALAPLDTAGGATFASRFGPTGDGVAKLLYMALSVFGFAVFSYAAERDPRLYARAWIVGAALAAAYTWVLFLSSVLGAPPLLLPGMEKPQYIGVAGHMFIRSGTFEEGNYLGLYLVCTVAVAIYVRNYLAAALLSLTTVITFSTVNVVALALLWLGVAWSAAAGQRHVASRAAAVITLLAVSVGGALLLATTGYVAEVVFDKLVTAEPGSRLDRLDQAVAGLRMFADHPVGGVGLSQYGYHYKAYQLTSFFGGGERVKPIANNIYVELLAETGAVGALLFVAFLRRVYRRARGSELAPLRWGMAATALAFNASPSYTMMFLWGYWALVVAAAARLDPERGR